MNNDLTGQVTSGDVFIWASYLITGAVLAGLAIWAFVKLSQAKRKLTILEAQDKDA